MRMKIYNFLVNRHGGIREKYHMLHDNADKKGKIISYWELLKMNAQYYFLNKKEYDLPRNAAFYEEKKLPCGISESAINAKRQFSIKVYLKKLDDFDIISVDIFDTLIFRPFSEPTDLFFFVGEKLGVLDFKRIRMEQEHLARLEHYKKTGNYEVNLEEIWKRIEKEVGIPAKEGMCIELAEEKSFCYPNPFMLELINGLAKKGKKIIALSDMYLPQSFVRELLDKNGYKEISEVYVSCELGKSKSVGDMYDFVKRKFREKKLVHIGDNRYSDNIIAKKRGFDIYPYHNVNNDGKKYRAFDMSSMVGGAYRGLVNNRLYNGNKKYSVEYEYGYIYGGIFVLGYCCFIKNYCMENGVDKILFLSRDGEILKKVYDRLFPESDTAYAYLSRSCACKLMAEFNHYDFFRRFIYHKINQNLSIGKILESMGLEELSDEIDAAYVSDSKGLFFKSSDFLTEKNAPFLKKFLTDNFSKIKNIYSELNESARDYYMGLMENSSKVAIVDIGWAGSGAISISFLAEKIWKIPCEVVGIVAGTNTIHNVEPDASETFLQSGKLVSYCFSQSLNRDIMKKHDPNKNFNVYWELILSSPSRQFLGFSFENENLKEQSYSKADKIDDYLKDSSGKIYKLFNVNGKYVRLHFGDSDSNINGIKRIRKGIMDFVEDYCERFSNYPYMFNISGRDAAAPMLLAASFDEQYLKSIEKKFDFKIDV